MAQESTVDLGQRRLAAIIFTDVVGFSARMQENETETLRLVERDSQFIRGVCENFNGRILKSTGDGLLMFFDSAVDAVAAALKIQEGLGQHRAASLPSDALEHRIGIHLGDVFIRDGDVMGDGVNIAARLQQEAQPGGICISQTVYEVVKNKLSLQVISLGPRELKNIRDAVPAYQVLLDAEKVLRQPGSRRGTSRMTTGRMLALSLAAVAAVAIVAGGIWYARDKRATKAQPVSVPSVASNAVVATPKVEEASVAVAKPEVKPTPSTPVAQPSPIVGEPQPVTPVAPPTSVARAIPQSQPMPQNSAEPEPPIAPAPPTRALQMSTRWIQGEMYRFSRSNRLKIVAPPRLTAIATNMPPTTAWLEGTVLHFDVGGKDSASDLSRTAPIVLEYTLYSLTQVVGESRAPSPIRRIFEGGPPPSGGSEAEGQQGPPMPPEEGGGPNDSQGRPPIQGGSFPQGPPQR